MTASSLAERLREERERLGLTQEQCADFAGAKKQTHYRYEAGDREPKASYLDKLGRIGMDVTYVLTGTRRAAGERVRDDDEDVPVGAADPWAARIGERIREWREGYPLTRADLAASLGITADELKRIEYGRDRPSWRLLSRLVNEHQTSGDFLLWGDDP